MRQVIIPGFVQRPAVNKVWCPAIAVAMSISGTALAQYLQFNLVSTSSPFTPNNDPNLVNGWGLAFFPTSPFWVADNFTGVATLYDHSGTPLGSAHGRV